MEGGNKSDVAIAVCRNGPATCSARKPGHVADASRQWPIAASLLLPTSTHLLAASRCCLASTSRRLRRSLRRHRQDARGPMTRPCWCRRLPCRLRRPATHVPLTRRRVSAGLAVVTAPTTACARVIVTSTTRRSAESAASWAQSVYSRHVTSSVHRSTQSHAPPLTNL